MNRHFLKTKRCTNGQYKYEKFLWSYIIREMQIKTIFKPGSITYQLCNIGPFILHVYASVYLLQLYIYLHIYLSVSCQLKYLTKQGSVLVFH
jgi:hypothetical protein